MSKHEEDWAERRADPPPFPAHRHIRNVCKHGVVMMQCRCASPTKVTRTVPCHHVLSPWPAPMTERHLSAHEWLRICVPGIKVLDPDGWRQNDGVTMDTPITQKDFVRRLIRCTVTHVRITKLPEIS